MTRRLVSLALATTALAAACSTRTTASGTADTPAQVPLVAMPSVEQFAATFDADRGVPRLILLISPT
jgi:hypothetical protein